MAAGCLLYTVFTLIRRHSARRTREAEKDLEYVESRRGVDMLRILIGYELLTVALYCVDVWVGPGSMIFQLPLPWWLR
mgnify:CR=1 FL=1